MLLHWLCTISIHNHNNKIVIVLDWVRVRFVDMSDTSHWDASEMKNSLMVETAFRNPHIYFIFLELILCWFFKIFINLRIILKLKYHK